MKKRYHTNLFRNHFSINASFSMRSQSMRARGASRGSKSTSGVSEKLASVSDEGVVPLAEWNQEEVELKLEDEISENDLKAFAFSCIESLSALSQSGSSVLEVLAILVSERLTCFTDLAKESQDAKEDFKEYAAWSKRFIDTVQPLLASPAGLEQEVDQLTNQMMECAERSMGKRFRAESLRRRVEFLIGSVAAYVENTGVEVGLPQPVMNKVAMAVRRVLTELAKQ